MTLTPIVKPLSCARGVTAVEFALLLPVLLMTICGTIEFGYMNLARLSLAGAVADAARITAVDLELEPEIRRTRMENIITGRMSTFPVASGSRLMILSRAFSDEGKVFAEDFDDRNKNGVYDDATSTSLAEPFRDRNGNGKWDPSVRLTEDMGGEGDLVQYEASYPAALFFPRILGLSVSAIALKASTISRNEKKGLTS